MSCPPIPGTAILLKPGIIFGGVLQHDCPKSRSIGYFLEPIIMLAPFAKRPVQLTLKGITTDEHDLSVCFFYFLKRKIGLIHSQVGGSFADSNIAPSTTLWNFKWVRTTGEFNLSNGEQDHRRHTSRLKNEGRLLKEAVRFSFCAQS